MPGVTDDNEDSESRTASVGGVRRVFNAPAAQSPPSHSTSSKRLKHSRNSSQDLSDSAPAENIFSQPPDVLQELILVPTNHAESHQSAPSLSEDGEIADMSSPHSTLGKNRLATGFPAPVTLKEGLSSRISRSYSDSASGDSKDDAIEISDDELEDSQGGMVINVQGQEHVDNADSDTDEDENMEFTSDDEYEEHSRSQLHNELTGSFLPAQVPMPRLRLIDLNPEDLELQIKYSLFHFTRNQIDLNRPVTCLSCLNEGHMSNNCPEKVCALCGVEGQHSSRACPKIRRCPKCRERGHVGVACTSDMKVTTTPCDLCGSLSHVEDNCTQRFFPHIAYPTGPVKLWISCCVCASKGHLVGDCPDVEQSAAARWSLKSLDANQIINMSLETGTRRLEKEAESRGMRPKGLQIKGRANLHYANASGSRPPSDDEKESFLRPRVGQRPDQPRPRVRLGQYDARRPGSPPRRAATDRYNPGNPPSFDQSNKGRDRSGWYGTDSFGRRRSQSPGPDYRDPPPSRGHQSNSWRPGDSRRRTPSPRGFNGHWQSDQPAYRARSPPPGDSWRPRELPGNERASFHNRARSPLHSQSGIGNNPSTSMASTRDVVVQLPTRKGSNPNLPPKPTAIAGSKSSAQSYNSQNGGGGAGRKKNKKKGRGRGGGRGA